MAKKKRRRAMRKSKKKAMFGGMSRGHGLGAINTVDEFRDAINAQPSLSTDDRLLLIEQASVLVEDLYTHLPLKRAMHSIDPLQRL